MHVLPLAFLPVQLDMAYPQLKLRSQKEWVDEAKKSVAE